MKLKLCMCTVHLATLHVLNLKSPLAIARSNSTVHDESTGLAITVPLQTFVNPAGHRFSAATVKEIPGLRVFGGGAGTVDATWFAGYAWRILSHPACRKQAGWRFSRVEGLTSTNDEGEGTTSLFDLVIWDELQACEGSGFSVLDSIPIIAAPDIAGGVGIPHARGLRIPTNETAYAI
jgi:hypothetical protein